VKGVVGVGATEILKEEHRAIERVTTALEIAANRLNRGEEVYLRFFFGTSFFIKSFTDGYHHMKEETILFPALIGNGLSNDSGPVPLMLAEHQQARKLSLRMQQVTERFQSGDENVRDLVVQTALGYVRLLRQHMQKEDNLLYPIADKVIPAVQQQEMMDAFRLYEIDMTGEDVHEKYTSLADRLVNESMR
jgi:hemerythrin-like domain-containing protein